MPSLGHFVQLAVAMAMRGYEHLVLHAKHMTPDEAANDPFSGPSAA